MNIKERRNGTEGTIQTFGHGHLITSDRTVAQSGSSDAYLGEGSIQENPPETGSVEQFAPALKAEKSATTPVVARVTKDTGWTNFGKTHGVKSAPQLMAAHRHGSISKDDANAVHGRDTEPQIQMSKPESSGSSMPQTAVLKSGYVENSEVTGPVQQPVIARPSGGLIRSR
jgi:hypothetical protein